MLYAALVIFIVTVALVIWQPRGLNIGLTAACGGLFAIVTNVVSMQDVFEVTSIVWNATLSFIAVMLISLVLDEAGFFEWAALHMARQARGSGWRLFFLVVLLGTFVSAFYGNDGAVLILTPIMLAIVRTLRFADRTIVAFVMAGGFVADTTSLPLVVSNLTNIISADYFRIGFIEYAVRMIVPNAFSFAASLLVLGLVYRRSIPGAYDVSQLKRPRDAIKDETLFRISWFVSFLLLAAYLFGDWLRIPVSLVAGAAAVILMTAAHRCRVVKMGAMLKEAPWTIIVFSIGMYVVVYGLRNVGMTSMLGQAIERMADSGLFAATVGMGILAAVLSSAMNNLPTVMIGALSIHGTDTTGLVREALIYANVIGVDLGPKMTPIGSLATLIWLHVLNRKGVRIGWGYYFKTGVILTVPTLFITLSALYVWLRLLH